MIQQPTPKQIELHNQSRSFHAKIAQKASELRPVPAKSFSVPNAPYGIPKRGVRQLPSPRYVQPAQFTLAYEAAWLLEICGVQVTDDFSSKQVMDRVKRTVAAFYKMTLIDLLSHRRTKPYVIPRQVAMYLCKTMTMRSLPEIGRAFADRDHTTILHAVRKIEGLIAADDQFAGVVAVLRTRCGGGK